MNLPPFLSIACLSRRGLGLAVLVGVVFSAAPALAQQRTATYLAELRKIQADYCRELWYPRTQTRPDENLRCDLNDAKQQRIAKLSTQGVEGDLLALVKEATALSNEVSETSRKYVDAVTKAGKKYVDRLPDLIIDPPEGPELIAPLIPGLLLEVKLNTLRKRCQTAEPDFTRRWKVKLVALAASQPALRTFADDPESCSPLSAFSVPAVTWTEQPIGTSHENPYRLGDLTEAIEFEVEPTSKGSWRYSYRFSLPRLSGPLEFVNVQINSSQGYAHACLNKVMGKRVGTANERANARAGTSDQLQFPLEPGEQYLLSVYHIHKPDFGPQWSGTKVTVRMWPGKSPDVPKALVRRTVNADQQRKWLEQQRLSEAAARQLLQQTTFATFSGLPRFDGRFSEAGAIHPFSLRVTQYVAESKGVTGEIDWPTYGGSTRVRGQLINTKEGLELNLKETDFVPGKASNKLLLGGEYRLRPEFRDDKLFFRGEYRLKERVHPLIMQTTPVGSGSSSGTKVATTPPVTSPPGPVKPGPAPQAGTDPATPAAFAQEVKRPAPALTHKAGELQVFRDVTAYDGPQGLMFSKDGKNAMATGYHLRAWDLARGVEIYDQDQNSFQATLMPNGSKVLFLGGVGSASHALFQMQLKKGAPPPSRFDELERTTALAVSRDNKVAVVSRNPGVLVFFDLAKNRKGSELPVNRDVTSLAFGHSSTVLLTGDDQNGIRIWDLTGEGRLSGRFDGHGKNADIRLIAVSEDGRTVASIAGTETSRSMPGPLSLIIWDRETLEEKHSVSLGQQATCVSLSPDWQQALVGEQSGEVGAYAVASGECLETLKGHTKPVSAVCFSPCWNFALTASSDDTVRLWGLENAK